MSELTNTFISDTYVGVIHSEGQMPSEGVTKLYDGLGNEVSISIGRKDNGVSITGNINTSGDVVAVGKLQGSSLTTGAIVGGLSGEGATIYGKLNVTTDIEATGNLKASNVTYPTASASSTLFELIYPIGSIYLSVNNVNPGTLFPGTLWEKASEGRYLASVGTDSDYPTHTFTEGKNTGSYEEEYDTGMIDHIHGVGSMGGGNDDGSFIMKPWTSTTTETGRGINGDGGGGWHTRPPAYYAYGLVTSPPLDLAGLPIENTGTIPIKPPSFAMYVWQRVG